MTLQTFFPEINITQEEAYQIALEYWNGYEEDEIVYDGLVELKNKKPYYAYRLMWYEDNHFSTIDWLYVDASTGDTTYMAGEPNNN